MYEECKKLIKRRETKGTKLTNFEKTLVDVAYTQGRIDALRVLAELNKK